MEKKQKQSTENFIKDIRRKNRVFSSEQKDHDCYGSSAG